MRAMVRVSAGYWRRLLRLVMGMLLLLSRVAELELRGCGGRLRVISEGGRHAMDFVYMYLYVLGNY